MSERIKPATDSLLIGDVFTMAGVNQPDRRSRWRRLIDWLLRRPEPKSVPIEWRVTKDQQ